LLGWVAGEMAVSDPAVKGWIDEHAVQLATAAPFIGAGGVLAAGLWLGSRARRPLA
jgi:hypothetical protein